MSITGTDISAEIYPVIRSIPASERVWTTPELLVSIFALIDPQYLVSAAQVNRIWCEPVLDNIWRNLASIIPLLKILDEDSSGTALSDDIRSDRWERLKYYDERVRTLSHDDQEVSKSVYITILLHTVHRRQFLPNLRKISLKFGDRLEFGSMTCILSPSVQELEVTLCDMENHIGEFFEHLIGRSHHIQNLSIVLSPCNPPLLDMYYPVLVDLFHEMPRIVSIALPQFTQSPAILEALGSLPRLKRLVFSDWKYQGTSHPSEPSFQLGQGTFRSLEELAVNSSLGNAASILSSDSSQNTLTSLCIHTHPWLPTRPVLRHFLTSLASSSPNLDSLKLNMFNEPPNPTSPEPLHISDFNPLESLELKVFEVGYNHPIRANLQDFEWIAKAWPSLQELRLNPDPVIRSWSPGCPDTTTLSAATKFLHSLRHLGVFIVIGKNTTLFSSETSFKHLEALDLGTSVLSGQTPEAVAIFLTSLMPDTRTKLTVGASIWHPQSFMVRGKNLWDSVRMLVPQYLEAQAGFRRALALSHKEKEQLRRRVEVLEQQLGTAKIVSEKA